MSVWRAQRFPSAHPAAAFAWRIIAIVMALVISGAILAVMGSKPLGLGYEVLQGSFGSEFGLEDVSRFHVTLHRWFGENAPDWTGEVSGPPHIYSLKTVDLLAAGQSLVAFDKQNKKLWEGKLTYSLHWIPGRPAMLETLLMGSAKQANQPDLWAVAGSTLPKENPIMAEAPFEGQDDSGEDEGVGDQGQGGQDQNDWGKAGGKGCGEERGEGEEADRGD